MKKNKFFMFILVISILFVPFFAGCKDTRIKLVTPYSVNYQSNDDTGLQMIVTEKNSLATAYLFGISETESDNPDDFVKWVVNATEEKIIDDK